MHLFCLHIMWLPSPHYFLLCAMLVHKRSYSGGLAPPLSGGLVPPVSVGLAPSLRFILWWSWSTAFRWSCTTDFRWSSSTFRSMQLSSMLCRVPFQHTDFAFYTLLYSAILIFTCISNPLRCQSGQLVYSVETYFLTLHFIFLFLFLFFLHLLGFLLFFLQFLLLTLFFP